jgi:hypothetical protein
MKGSGLKIKALYVRKKFPFLSINMKFAQFYGKSRGEGTNSESLQDVTAAHTTLI